MPDDLSAQNRTFGLAPIPAIQPAGVTSRKRTRQRDPDARGLPDRPDEEGFNQSIERVADVAHRHRRLSRPLEQDREPDVHCAAPRQVDRRAWTRLTVLRSTPPPALERRSELGVQLRQHREADVVGNFVRSLFTTRRSLPPAVRPLSRDGDTSLASLTLGLLRITRLVSSLHPSGHEGGGSLDAFAIQDRN